MRRPVLFILGVVVWFLLVWPFVPGTLRLAEWESTVIGVIVAALVAVLFGEKRILAPRPGMLKRCLWMALYIPMFLWWCLLANLDVMYRVIHPDMPIRPGIVKVKTTLRTHSALTALANSITLTPGTFVVDIDPEQGYLFIHWIYVLHEDLEGATRAIVSKFEKILRRIYE